MEKTNFGQPHHLNGTAIEPLTEPWSLQDKATGRNRPVRDMTDQEIERYSVDIGNALPQLRGAADKFIELSQLAAVLDYEKNRRRLALQIASKIPA